MALEPTLIVSQLISGISRGMIYFTLASGLTLIFGVLNVVNFSHGAFYMLGVYVCYSLAKQIHFGVAFVLVPIILAMMGGVSEFLLFRRIYKAEHVMQLLLSFGLVQIISDLVRLGWGLHPKSLGMPQMFVGYYNLYGIIITKYNLFIIVMTTVIAFLMYAVIYKTKVGSIIRACQIDPEMTRCAGIDVSRTFLIVFMSGVGLAGVSAVVATPIGTAMLGMDTQMIIVAFSVVIIGGVGKIGGTMVASMIIAVIESLGILILPGFAEVFMYVIVSAVLLLKPSGLFGRSVS